MTDLLGRRAFLSGPMTGRLANNVAEFMDAETRLNALGAECVYNPAFEWCAAVHAGCDDHDHEWYMRRCIAELTSANGDGEPYYDLLVQLDGWRESDGANVEYVVASACGMECVELGELTRDD